MSLGLMKRYLLLWLEHMRKIMCICLNYISSLKVRLLVVFCSLLSLTGCSVCLLLIV